MSEFKDLERETKKLRNVLAKLQDSKFSYYEQELIHRVIKSVLPQMQNINDLRTAQDILDKTEWLDE
jgi:hypothetical protein